MHAVSLFALALFPATASLPLVSSPAVWDSIPEKTYAVRKEKTPPAAFRFASSQGDGMVLQMAPSQATVWGFMPSSSIGKVSVLFMGQTIKTVDKMWLGSSTWLAKLPATNGG